MCVSPRSAADDFDRAYDDAVVRLGPPFPKAGQPDVRPIPGGQETYLQGVRDHPRFDSSVQIPGLRSWSFKLMEIDRLLIYQVSISNEFVKRHSGDPSHPPTIGGMLRTCLPLQLDGEQPIVSMRPNVVQITLRDMYCRLLGGLQHVANPRDQISMTGVFCASSSNLAQVVRCNDRTYLKNGVHRAYALRSAGATHMPCLYLETSDWSAVGAVGGSSTFDRDLLESANPPTCAHFSQGRAMNVTLRTMTRIVEVTWSDRIVSEDP